MSTVTAPAKVIDLEKWRARLPELTAAYQTDYPFPHIYIDNFLEEDAARAAMEAFPGVTDAGWIHYVHVNEKKHGLNKMDRLPEYIQHVIKELNSPEFCAFLSEMTGIPNLLPDDMLEGGGLHQSGRNGYLNIHADFTVHPHKRNWQRRVNLLVYLNENWQPEYKGELQLWTRDMKECAASILPVFNRAALFNTDEDSFHGLPDPIQCPEGMTRKSIALYYFTEETNKAPRKRSTNYQARPQDGSKRFLIWFDKKMVAAYSSVKSALGLNDDFVSNLLNRINGKKKQK